MAGNNFSTLNDTDLEELVRDVLNAKEKESKSGIEYRIFKEGKDKGIDFIYSPANDKYAIVGQVKHYFKSGVSALIRNLSLKEVENVKKLNPSRYIIATSIGLSFDNKEKIYQVFTPYIKSMEDIYGYEDLNMLLDRFPEVLDRYYKLWFSNTEILQKILNYSVEGRTLEFTHDAFRRKLRLYVATPLYHQAKEIISKNKILIITGQPGVGKTTLAEMLVYYFIKENYKLTYIYDDVKEAEKLLKNDDTKQLFYFDDFLGHNTYEIYKAKGNESAF